jgi:hypothetical protein
MADISYWKLLFSKKRMLKNILAFTCKKSLFGVDLEDMPKKIVVLPVLRLA